MKRVINASRASKDHKRGKRQFVTELSEPKSNQVLVVTHDDDLTGLQLDVEAREDGEKMADGVVIARLGARSIVCFVELKSTLKPKEGKEDPVTRAFAQLNASTSHFHPAAGSHGAEHHESWSSGAETLAVMPSKNHEVIELVVAYRAVPRQPPEPPRVVGSTRVHRKVVQVSPAVAGRAETSFEKLMALAGLPGR